jgi:hypothetical protein
MARELRERYLEEANTGRTLPAAKGKYDVNRQLAGRPDADDVCAQAVALLNGP